MIGAISSHYVVAGGGGGSGYSAAVLADSPLAYYRLGETSGTTMVDSSGNGRNGTYDSGVTLGGASLLTGDSDKSLDLPGSAVGGNVALASWMQPTTFTAECWVIFDSFPTSETAFVCRQSVAAANTSAKSFALGYFGGHFLVQAFVNNSTTNAVASSSGTRATGTRYYVATTFDGTTLRLYVNGTSAGSAALSGTLNPGTSPLEIGHSDHVAPYTLDGRIDEVAFYGTALSGTRIAAHYAAGV